MVEGATTGLLLFGANGDDSSRARSCVWRKTVTETGRHWPRQWALLAPSVCPSATEQSGLQVLRRVRHRTTVGTGCAKKATGGQRVPPYHDCYNCAHPTRCTQASIITLSRCGIASSRAPITLVGEPHLVSVHWPPKFAPCATASSTRITGLSMIDYRTNSVEPRISNRVGRPAIEQNLCWTKSNFHCRVQVRCWL